MLLIRGMLCKFVDATRTRSALPDADGELRGQTRCHAGTRYSVAARCQKR